MATHWFNFAKAEVLRANVDFEIDDIRIVPCMTGTDADTANDGVDAVSDLTLDEFNGANYVSGGLALDGQAVIVDDANDRAEFDCDPETVVALGAGTTAMIGVLLIKFIGALAASLPIAFLEFTTPKTPDGSNFTFDPNAEGVVQAT